MKKTHLYEFLLMSLFCSLCFIAFLAAADYRSHYVSTPLRGEAVTSAAPPLATLLAGSLAALQAAGASLTQGRRADAMSALDAARRSLQAASGAIEASQPQPQPQALAPALAAVEQARRDVQNGQPLRAPDVIGQAAAIVQQLLPAAAQGRLSAGFPPEGLQDFVGAQVIDGYGNRIGEIEAVHSKAGALAELELRVNPAAAPSLKRAARHLLIPVRRVVFGRPQWLGSTLVAVPDWRRNSSG